MKVKRSSLLLVLALTTVIIADAATDDPQTSSWLTSSSGGYARIYQTDAAKTAGTSVTTWSRGQGTQSSAVYAGVTQVSTSTSWVYIKTTGLGYHIMGPWYLDSARSQLFPNYPANTGVTYRIPRTPTVPTTKTLTSTGSIGYFVDGVSLFDNRDAFSYRNASATDASPVNGLTGDGIWNRDAYANEAVTFDAAFAHQAGANYHYHANTPALRYLLGDHVDYSSSTKTYNESSATPTNHSPILAWTADGYPLYGPYGYSSPLDANSGVRRMISGYQKRDGTNGTTNLSSTGRTTIPAWAALAQSRSATLSSSQYGPAVNTTYALGHYIEDYDYLGDLGKTQGTDFDLDKYNGRYCVTPEFPNGTYAYFMSIETDGTPKFPYNIGRWFYGNPTGGSVSSITETVTEYSRGAPAATIVLKGVSSGNGVALSWNSAEGATYKVESSANNSTWSTLSSSVTSSGITTPYTASSTANYFRVTLTAIATYDTKITVGTPVGTSGVLEYSGGSTGPAAQTITFDALPDVTYSTTPITLSATASSGLTVTFSVVSGPATLSGTSLTLTGTGTVTVRASQSGDSSYLAATDVDRSFTVSAANTTNSTDPRLTSWQTSKSAQYARVYESAAKFTSGTTVTTWPTSGLVTSPAGGVSTATYSDVQRVAYSTNYVYIQTTGLASYTMGNWLTPNGQTYTSFPSNRAAIHRIPRNPTIPTTKQKNNGSGGVLVNGVYVWQNGDAQSYANASSTSTTATISMSGDGVWNRLAGVAEVFNFDPANGHQPSSGAYHNHINPKALRYQLGDNVTYNSSTKTYSESGTPTKHSPIIGWANDGLPIYGPYGYSSALDSTSGIRRMTTGFVKRDATNATLYGTDDLAVTGRVKLPVWAASVQGISQTLASSKYGPSTTATYSQGPVSYTCSIGVFAEDYEYLGDLGKTQGVDFDLNRQNVRYCVTPEFPSGTYAYFTCIDSSGNTVFPDVINQEYFGTAPSGQGVVTSITETVTEYIDAGPAAAITINAATSGSGVLLSWNSAEGATYKVESSANNSTWTTLSSSVTSAGLTTTYTAASTANYFRVTLSAIATYGTGGTYGTPVGTTATVSYSAPLASQTITFAALSDVAYTTTPLTLSATASSGLTVTFSVVSGPATVSGTSLTLTGTGAVTVRASQPGDSSYLAADDVDRTFNVTTSFASWQSTYFTSDEIAAGTTTGAGEDPDIDNITNLVEYALGLDPKSVNYIAVQSSSDGSNWSLSYSRPTDRPDLTYSVEASTDLNTWSTANVSHSQTSISGSNETWQATYPIGSTTKLFFRLIITRN